MVSIYITSDHHWMSTSLWDIGGNGFFSVWVISGPILRVKKRLVNRWGLSRENKVRFIIYIKVSENVESLFQMSLTRCRQVSRQHGYTNHNIHTAQLYNPP
jgi:hypothetical protein